MEVADALALAVLLAIELEDELEGELVMISVEFDSVTVRPVAF